MKNKHKLIESDTKVELYCNNNKCNYTEDISLDIKILKERINSVCPKCDNILLTNEEYDGFVFICKIVKFINILFYPIVYFLRKNKVYNEFEFKIEEENYIINKINKKE